MRNGVVVPDAASVLGRWWLILPLLLFLCQVTVISVSCHCCFCVRSPLFVSCRHCFCVRSLSFLCQVTGGVVSDPAPAVVFVSGTVVSMSGHCYFCVRSLVALSLILSLLLFKPAPLYILDEVDAALDLSHTQNIGQMLKTHFRHSQVGVLHSSSFRILVRYAMQAINPCTESLK